MSVNLVGLDLSRLPENCSFDIQRIGKGNDSGSLYKRLLITSGENHTYIDVFLISDPNWHSPDLCKHKCDLCTWKVDDGELQHTCTRFACEDSFDKL
jgi:hypothetical protein